MSENQEIETGDDSGKGLRKQLEDALKVAKEAEARAAAATKALSERQLADVLSAKKIPSGFAKVISAEGVDPSDETAVDTWWKENAPKYGLSPEAETPTTHVPQAEQDAFGRMQNPDFQSPALRSELQTFLAKAKELSDKGDVAALDELYAGSKF